LLPRFGREQAGKSKIVMENNTSLPGLLDHRDVDEHVRSSFTIKGGAKCRRQVAS